MKTKSYFEQITDATTYLRHHIISTIQDAVILGTGLGGFVDHIDIQKEISYEEIPHFPASTVQSHAGKFIIGSINNKPVILLSGRLHYYEGYTMKQVTFPIRILQVLGIQNLFITNVAGGTHPDFEVGDLVSIKDHIYMMPENPLRGVNDPRLGPRFPDMSDVYSTNLRSEAHKIASELNIDLKEGVYYALPGPSLETPAEYELIHKSGGDLVGMSTAPEVIAASHGGLNIFAVSIVSNVCYPKERITQTSVEEILKVAEEAGSKLSSLLTALIP